MTGELPRRHPACGSELEHGPHEYTWSCKWDGTELEERDRPGHCAGWTATEADLCVMLRQVHVAMLEKAPPAGAFSGRFRLECSPLVAAALGRLLLPTIGLGRVDKVHGAELMLTLGDAGGWRLVEVSPPLASGNVRPLPVDVGGGVGGGLAAVNVGGENLAGLAAVDVGGEDPDGPGRGGGRRGGYRDDGRCRCDDDGCGAGEAEGPGDDGTTGGSFT